MNQIFSRFSAFALSGFLALALGQPASAQVDMDFQPSIVIASASINEHLDDVEHLFEASGFGDMKGLVRVMTSGYIKGLDLERPLGAMLFFEGANPEPEVLAFIPVTDIEDVLDTIADQVDIDESGDDWILTLDNGKEVTVRVVGETAFAATNPELLNNAPSDPAAVLQDLPTNYNLAARVYGQQVPQELRNQMIDLIREGAEQSMEELGDGPQAELQRTNFKYSMQSIESLVNETEEIVVGLCVDEENKRLLMDMKFVGLPDSRLARQCAAFADAPPSRFGGFLLDRAALNMNFTGKLLEDDIVQADSMIDDLKNTLGKELEKNVEEGEMSDGEAEAAKRIAGDLLEVLRDSVAGGVIDGGMAAVLAEDQISFAAGMTIASGEKLEASLRELADIARAEDAPLEIRLDASSADGIRYHEVDVLIPEDEEEARQLFGERLNLLLGVGDDVVYFAGGHNGKSLLDECRNGSAAGDQPTMQLNFHLLPFMRLMSKFQDAAELKMIVDMLPEAADDRIRATAVMIENGELVRMEMQDGLLEVFGKIGRSMGQGFPPPEDF